MKIVSLAPVFMMKKFKLKKGDQVMVGSGKDKVKVVKLLRC